MCSLDITRFVTWNADGLRTKIHELLELVSALSVDIFGICETRLSPKAVLNTPLYRCYRQDRHVSGRGQGVAIFVRENIIHTPIYVDKTRHLEVVGIKVKVSGIDHFIFSVYQSPNLPLLRSDLDILFALGSHVLIMGDLNANHEHWHSGSRNTRGRVLFSHMLDHDYNIFASKTPSQVNYRADLSPSNPDLILALNIHSIDNVAAIPAMSSNHLPVRFSIGNNAECKPTKQIFNYKKANWNSYRTHIDANLSLSSCTYTTVEQINYSIEAFQACVLAARDVSVPSCTQNTNSSRLPRHIKSLIRYKNKLRRVDSNMPSGPTKTHLRSVIHSVQKDIHLAIKCHQDKIWNDRLSRADNPGHDIWRVVKSFKPNSTCIPALTLSDGTKTSDPAEQCEVLAEAFCDNMRLTLDWRSPGVEKDVSKSIDELRSFEIPQLCHLTRPREVWKCLHQLNARKAPGDDDIHNLLLKNLSQKAVVYLTKIFNGCLALGYFPKIWKTAKVIALPKPNKDSSIPSSYRPISLLPGLGKLFEKIILARLQTATKGRILQEQFGFRAAHSTTQQLARVAEHIAHHLNLNESTGMVLLDIEKAFDTVWHEGLIHKLIVCGVPLLLVRLLQSYLLDRRFVVHISDTKSSCKSVPAGVPQGSILGPYLFLIFLHDMPIQNRTKLACFADDTASFTSSKDTDLILGRLQMSLDSLHNFFSKWKLKLNETKTEAIMFTRQRKPPKRQLKISGFKIPWSTSVRYLGLNMDTKLNWSKHISHLRIKGVQAMGALGPVLNRRSNLSSATKLRIYATLVRPSITYACPVWSSTCNLNYQHLQTIQNKAIKIAFNTPFLTNLRKLHISINFPTIRQFILKQTLKFFSKNKHHPNALIASIGQTKVEDLSYIDRYGTYKLPHHYVLFPYDDAYGSASQHDDQSTETCGDAAGPLARRTQYRGGRRGSAARFPLVVDGVS